MAKRNCTPTEVFHILNGRYFRSKLSKDTRIIFSKLCEKIGVLGFYEPGLEIWGQRTRGEKKGQYRVLKSRKETIYLHPKTKFSPRLWEATLLHEMVHQSGILGHGHKFQRKMKQLASRGAMNGLW